MISRRQWHFTPVLLPGKSHGQRSWWAAVHGVAKSWTRLNNFTHTHASKVMLKTLQTRLQHYVKNFQIFKLDLEKAEKPEIKLPTFTGLWRKQGNSRKTSTTASLTKLKPLTVWVTTNCGIFLSYLNIHLTCLLRNLYAGHKATVIIGHETTNWFQIGKGVVQGCLVSNCLFNLYAEYIMTNTGWMKRKLGSRWPGEISITSNMQMTSSLWQKVKN